jgi:hypothetical protein
VLNVLLIKSWTRAAEKATDGSGSEGQRCASSCQPSDGVGQRTEEGASNIDEIGVDAVHQPLSVHLPRLGSANARPSVPRSSELDPRILNSPPTTASFIASNLNRHLQTLDSDRAESQHAQRAPRILWKPRSHPPSRSPGCRNLALAPKPPPPVALTKLQAFPPNVCAVNTP